AYYYGVLNELEVQPHPFYQLSKEGRTDRLFGYGASPLALPRVLRDALFQDYVAVDLSACHLRTAATLWGARETETALATLGFSIWEELAEHLGVDTAAAKPALKRSLYSLVYGMLRPAVSAQLTRALGPSGS